MDDKELIDENTRKDLHVFLTEHMVDMLSAFKPGMKMSVIIYDPENLDTGILLSDERNTDKIKEVIDYLVANVKQEQLTDDDVRNSLIRAVSDA